MQWSSERNMTLQLLLKPKNKEINSVDVLTEELKQNFHIGAGWCSISDERLYYNY